MTGASHRLLAELRAMARTGRHSFTGNAVGALLAARLPKLIVGIAQLLESRREAGEHAHG